MKKLLLIIFSLIFCAGAIYAAQFEKVQEADDLRIRVLMANSPPVVGENILDIVLTDAKGNAADNSKIKIDYAMPPMGSMPPMTYKSRAKFDGESYKAKVNLAMSGTWNITVNVKSPGRSIAKMNFDVTVP